MYLFSRFIVGLIALAASAAYAQTWQRPTPEQGCPIEEAKQAEFKANGLDLRKLVPSGGAARINNTTPGDYINDSGPILLIEVLPPSGKMSCVARVQNYGLLRVPNNAKEVIINWSIAPTAACAARGQCRFDGAEGIHVVSDDYSQFSTLSFTDTKFAMTDRNQPQLRKAVMAYEPHVFWRRGDGGYISCCPKDPRIIND